MTAGVDAIQRLGKDIMAWAHANSFANGAVDGDALRLKYAGAGFSAKSRDFDFPKVRGLAKG